MKQVRVHKCEVKTMKLTKTVTRNGKITEEKTFDVEVRRDAHGVKLWYGDDWYLDQNKVGKTINPDPFTEVVWSVAEEEGKNAKAKRV